MLFSPPISSSNLEYGEENKKKEKEENLTTPDEWA